MASIAAHFAPAAIDAAPHLHVFCPAGVVGDIRFWELQRHYCGKQFDRGFSIVVFFGVMQLRKYGPGEVVYRASRGPDLGLGDRLRHLNSV